jgi:hypothetical protein
MTGQIDGSIVVWDDGNAGNTAQPEGGASREPRRPLFVWGMSVKDRKGSSDIWRRPEQSRITRCHF